jgi:DNA-binding LacI/PurR family transcriptional regulator
MLDRAIELNIAIIPIVLPAPDAQEKEVDNSLLELNKNYCGIIHLGDRGYVHDPVLDRVVQLQHMPQIAISCEFSQPWIGAVTFDPNHLAQVVVSHFRECGHMNICLVYPHESGRKNLGCKYMMTSKDSVHQPFKNTHIKFDNICEIRVRSRSYDQKFKDDVEEIINRDKQPTAFWCRDDLTAITLINELKLHGYSVPDDFSVMGFDNLIEAAEADPPLTTLSNPLYELGYAAISKLDDYINSGINEKNRITRLSPVLSIRQSTGIINNKKRI